ncbi:hypothetical protein [Chitinophaga solisilvae]|uniref:hypothetical protein n=1 Tax=Chitinophaga solisilvae TaxID=1233460 RepID=UPI00136CF247|nr:hypothetical protein [Chitinophaga solisilvae]
MTLVTKDKIIETFNESVSSLEESHSLAQAGRINDFMMQLSSSAGLIYSTLEWVIKNYLLNIFTDPITNANEIRIIERPNFHDKLHLFVGNTTPPIRTTDIDTACISDLKRAVRNDPEHSGAVPHYNSLIKVLEETRKIILTYLNVSNSQLKQIPDLSPVVIDTSSEWNRLFSLMNVFGNNQNYILVADFNQILPDLIKPFALVDWSAVIDLDNASANSGFFHVVNSEISSRKPIHQFTLGDVLPSSFSDRACYWLYGNGIDGRTSSVYTDFRFWNRDYQPFFTQVFAKLQLAISSKPTTVLIVSDKINYTTEVVKWLFNSFGTSMKFVFANANLDDYFQLATEYEGEQVKIKIPEIAVGLSTIRTYFEPLAAIDDIVIPHKDEGTQSISSVDYQWLGEDIELLHKSIYKEDFDSHDERMDFYKGGKLGWKGLLLGYDLPRDLEPVLDQKLEKNLRERLIKTISLFHYPGIGATTISKRVAWKIKEKYPVAFVRRYRPNETINRIYYLFQQSSLPPLIVMDSEDVNNDSRLRIFNEALTRNFPVTFWEIQRKITKPSQLRTSQDYISEVLSDKEVVTFSQAYIELSPRKKYELDAIVNSANSKEKHPLFFGLTAFEENFSGLASFIRKAVDTSENDEIQKQIVALICFCGVYAQRSLSAQCFSGFLSLPESVSIRLENYLNEALLHLIVSDGTLIWRPLHYLVAKQYLVVMYGGNLEEMTISLTDLSIKFIELLGNRSFDPSEDEFELLNRLFIDRIDNEDEEDEKQFSKLVEEGLSSSNAKLIVLSKLAETFPKKIHYWSHLARLYNLVIKNQERAEECIDIAIQLDLESNGKDHTLYHIKGMILVSTAKSIMQRNRYSSDVDLKDLEELERLVSQSGLQFEIARNYNPNSRYGYITNIDAITSYLDFKYSKSKLDDRGQFLTKLNDFDANLFREARLLLEELQAKLNHTEDDYYFTRAKNNLRQYFTNYSVIIQTWQNLLSTSKTNKLAIRLNLVYAYVDRASGWEMLTSKDLNRILNLLDDNIDQDPTDIKNIFLWFRAARVSEFISIDTAIQKLARWRTLSNSIEVRFYLAILYVIDAINGNSFSAQLAVNLIREVSESSRHNPQRTFISELYGHGVELKHIILRRLVVTVEDGIRGLKLDHSKLVPLRGRVVSLTGPELGLIEFANGLQASFIPARADKGNGLIRGRNENVEVEFFLGFSYDGLKALDVAKVSH